MKSIKIVLLLGVITVLIGCSKDQQMVNKLVGTWQVQSWKVSAFGLSQELPTAGASYKFDHCKLKSDEWCSGHFILENKTTNFQYKVIDNGKKFVSRNSDSTKETVFDILSISDTEAKVKAQIDLLTHEITLIK